MKFRSLLILLVSLIVFSCKDDPALPDNFIAFQTNLLGFNAADQELKVNVNFSYAATQAGTITISVQSDNMDVARELIFIPAASANLIQIPFAIGDFSKEISIKKSSGVLFDGDETLRLIITTEPIGYKIGINPILKVNFSEIVSPGAPTTIIDGGGNTYPNKVFIDLSANRITLQPRTDWDLAFASGSEFRVLLNASNGMLAKKTDKTDIKSVTAADTVALGDKLSIAAIFAAANFTPNPAWLPSSSQWCDDPSGDLTKTSIAEIGISDTTNKVYIINPGTGPGIPGQPLTWKKIKVNRKGNGYTLQFGDINSSTISEIDITKDVAYNFQFVSFAKGNVKVEPEKEKWDIAWTGFTIPTNLGPFAIPYYFQDIIVQNRNKVQTAQVLNTAIPYESFTEASLNGFDFGAQSQIKIGSSWRSGGGPTSAPAIRTDRYYIIKDVAGNIFKLKFNALSSNGERGKPSFEYSLLKKG